jgi:hypothetical protein
MPSSHGKWNIEAGTFTATLRAKFGREQDQCFPTICLLQNGLAVLHPLLSTR